MTDAPRLSVVVTARNDDHGGDLLRRMQIFVDGFFEQARRYRLDGELIIVEWNPPVDRPRLVDALRWPTDSGPCRVRIIEVPPAVHHRFQYADRLPMFQMIAKNVAIRRAQGEFVLATNIDVLFSEALMEFLVSGPLDGECMYRVDRRDVAANVPVGVSIGEQLEFCRRHVLRVCTRWGTFVPGESRWLAILRRVPPWIARRSFRARRVLNRARYGIGRLRRRLMMGVRLDIVLAILQSSATKGFRGVRLAAGILYSSIVISLQELWQSLRRPLHTNACGDFTLLSRERWFALRGYPELKMFSLHLDSVLCQMAFVGGAREVVLDNTMRLYHMDHASGWSPGEAEMLAARIRALGVPMLDYQQYRVWVRESLRRRGPIIFNGENWGLVQECLSEVDPIERGRRTVHAIGQHVRT